MTHAHTPSPRTETAAALLWTCAIALLATIIVVAGRIPSGNQALAEMSTVGSDYSLMTTKGGSEELLYVLDNRGGILLVYLPQNNRPLELVDVVNANEFVERATRPRPAGGP